MSVVLLLALAAQAEAPAAPNAEPVPAAPVPAEPDPIDNVAASALDFGAASLEAEAADEKRLRLYGFADVNYWQPLVSSTNPWGQFLPSKSAFLVGNINTYLDTTLSERVRSLIEVRFLYSPLGATSGPDQSTGEEVPQNTGVFDPAEFGREIRWGGILIERAWMEYRLHQLLTIRAGQFLTPWGIWNVDHGSPTLIGIRRPYIVREQLFPERQTGIELYGEAPIANAFALGWHLTLSNGRGNVDAYQDFDDNKAIGGRVFLRTLDRGLLTVGFSAYRGRDTKGRYQWSLDANGKPRRDLVAHDQKMELALAFDARLQIANVLFQTEIAYAERGHNATGWYPSQSRPQYLESDTRRGGGYVLLGYRTPFFGLMPYTQLEVFETPGTGGLGLLAGRYGDPFVVYGGLNARPLPDVVLKLEFAHGRFLNAAPGSWGEHTIDVLQAQVAWAF